MKPRKDFTDHNIKKLNTGQADTMNYQSIYSKVANLFRRVLHDDSKSKDIAKLWRHTLKMACDSKQEKTAYQLAMIQHTIDNIYHFRAYFVENYADRGIIWINKVIRDILTRDNLQHEAESRIIKTVLPFLCVITMPYITFPKPGNVISDDEYPAITIMDKTLRDLFDEPILPHSSEQHNSLTEDKPWLQDKIRLKLLNDLDTKESEYIDTLFRAISDAANVKSAEKLIIRLVGVSYLREKIQSNTEIDAKTIKAEMIKLFGTTIFETRGIVKSDLESIVDRLSSLTINKLSIFASALSAVTDNQLSELPPPQRTLPA